VTTAPIGVATGIAVALALLLVAGAAHAAMWALGMTLAPWAEAAAALATLAALPPLAYAGVRSRTSRRAAGHDDPSQHELVEQRDRVRDVLSAGDSLQVVFQPVVDLASSVCVGHEALARFADGRPPDVWFAEAASAGLGVELEMAAIARAAQRYRGPGRLSINLSPDTLTSAVFMEYLTHWEDASRIVVELTEHAVVEDYDQIAAALGRIRALGVLVAVDDAGNGTSSLRHILDLKPDIIKLDRSLIAGLDTDMPRRALAASLVRFAADIGALLVAEGIERDEERLACLELGIALGQGYLLGRPAPL
jgi:EAL domain-containing protein (putative c-di-GMP-specific phosphodiesterase class I)